MILKGSQRSGAMQLAVHLLNTNDNDMVEIHEIRGFVADHVKGAFKEMQAISRGTKCTQFMFSVSLNPPQDVIAPIEYFEKAINAIEERNGLNNQPRIIVFHEKHGRRHCHAVWSRIKADEMKAINLPHYKLKLRDISRQLYFDYGWNLPEGMKNAKNCNPLNFTLAEYQQAKRIGENPKIIKSIMQECWSISDNKTSLTNALKRKWLQPRQRNPQRLCRG